MESLHSLISLAPVLPVSYTHLLVIENKYSSQHFKRSHCHKFTDLYPMFYYDGYVYVSSADCMYRIDHFVFIDCIYADKEGIVFSLLKVSEYV